VSGMDPIPESAPGRARTCDLQIRRQQLNQDSSPQNNSSFILKTPDFSPQTLSNLSEKILILMRVVGELCYANATQATSSPKTLNPKQKKKRRKRMDPP